MGSSPVAVYAGGNPTPTTFSLSTGLWNPIYASSCQMESPLMRPKRIKGMDDAEKKKRAKMVMFTLLEEVMVEDVKRIAGIKDNVTACDIIDFMDTADVQIRWP